MNYFTKEISEIFTQFGTNKNGLDSIKVKELQEKNGFNRLDEKEKNSTFKIFFEQFKDFLVIILIIAGIISIISGNVESSIVIFLVITLNAILGTVQHLKAEASLESLKAMSSPNAKVIRNGVKQEIKSEEVTVGDILILETGDLIIADGRVIDSFSLQVNESSLTGESESINKFSDVIIKNDIPLGDQKNMVFSSGLVTYGRGQIVVTAIGMNTEIGKIAKLLEDTKERKTPLQISLEKFGKNLSIGIIILCAIVFILNLIRGVNLLDSLMFAVALAVAAIPEALSSIVTIVLALGTQKMAKQNAIVKYLKAVEGLGSIQVICSDKTGTLTQNKMTTRKIYVNNSVIEDSEIILDGNQKKLIEFGILCSDATIQENREIGDPTEIALINLGKKHGIDEVNLRSIYKRISELPFDSNRKLMSTLVKIDEKFIMITKGAIDIILKKVKNIDIKGTITTISGEDIKKIENENYKFSDNGLRVLAFAYKVLDKNELDFNDETDFTFLGLISMIDPPREESKIAVEKCKIAGIKPVMITGDHKITARAIAREIGIYEEGDKIFEGVDLEKISDEELRKIVKDISVYARVSPEHKIRIVNAWQDNGNIVAMTGDGVNDAPALKQANIGVAMGITGTEVSKDAASMILTDDNFATIIKSIEYGRNIFNNIQNSIKFLLSGNMAGILSVLYASIIGLPMPFAPVHLLFINLLTDSLPAIAIGLEKSNTNVLTDKPRDSSKSILNKDFAIKIVIEGIIIALVTMIAFHIGLKENTALASTMAFSVLCLSRLYHGFSCRSKQSLFKLGITSNKFTIIAFAIGFILLISVLKLEVLHKMFEISDLNLNNLLITLFLPLIPLVIIQLYKLFRETYR
ncbi:MAG: cation-translocating P-type ATPase, partial [Fusobacteriaceae bacterium]|nr:cation-translocating P-type ATPase [Fusobacteriaceae bacterium]